MGAIIKPSIVYSSGGYVATTAAISLSGNDFNYGLEFDGGLFPDRKYCIFLTMDDGYINCVGTQSADSNNEPYHVARIDGDHEVTGNLGVLLITYDDESSDPPVAFKATLYVPQGPDVDEYKPGDGTIECVRWMIASSIEIDPLTIPMIKDVFLAQGAGSNYLLNESAITDYGAALWGGDGAGGERSRRIISSSSNGDD